MSRILTQSREVGPNKWLVFLASDQFAAISVAVLFHLIVIAMLVAGWQENKPVPPQVSTIKVQVMMQVTKPEVTQTITETLPKVIETPPPVMAPKTIKEAPFAKKRVDEPLIDVTENPVRSKDESIVIPSPNVNKSMDETSSNLTRTLSEKTAIAPSSNSSNVESFDSSQYFPMQKDAPSYPQRALDKNLQGVCTVRYTVNTEGRVESPEALGDCHAFFIKPSLEATKSFKYTPRIVDGKAVKVQNVKNTFLYRIE